MLNSVYNAIQTLTKPQLFAHKKRMKVCFTHVSVLTS